MNTMNTMNTETEVKVRKNPTYSAPQKPDNPNIEGLVNSGELARVLGCTPRTIHNLVKRDKDFPRVKIGRLNRYILSEVLNYLR